MFQALVKIQEYQQFKDSMAQRAESTIGQLNTLLTGQSSGDSVASNATKAVSPLLDKFIDDLKNGKQNLETANPSVGALFTLLGLISYITVMKGEEMADEVAKILGK